MTESDAALDALMCEHEASVVDTTLADDALDALMHEVEQGLAAQPPQRRYRRREPAGPLVVAQRKRACAPPPEEVPRKKLLQSVIDLGGKNPGVVHCKGCGMDYAPSLPEELALHHEYHREVMRGPVHRQQDGDVVRDQAGGGKWHIVHVQVLTPAVRATLEHVCAAMDAVPLELGGDVEPVVVLCCEGESVLGCAVAEVLPGHAEGGESRTFWVTRLWTRPEFRRRGIATALVDGVCRSMLPGFVYERRMVGLAAPTSSGAAFESAYHGEIPKN